MGPLFVLLLWTMVAGVLSVVGGLCLTGLVAFLTRGVGLGRRRALWIAGALPAAGFAYLFGCVVVFSIWSIARGRDMGWGDSWDTPILGDYHLMMIDVTDQGTVYNRADPSVYGGGSVDWRPGQQDVISGVRRLEVRPPFLFGAANPETFMGVPEKSPKTVFFVLDTRSGTRTDEPTLAVLEADAKRSGGPLKLEPVDVVYGRNRYGKGDLIPVVLFAVPFLIALFILARALFRLRATRSSEAQQAG
jgi:hypothetical protein